MVGVAAFVDTSTPSFFATRSLAESRYPNRLAPLLHFLCIGGGMVGASFGLADFLFSIYRSYVY